MPIHTREGCTVSTTFVWTKCQRRIQKISCQLCLFEAGHNPVQLLPKDILQVPAAPALVRYRLTENTWPCRTSAEGTHQRKEDSHSQPQQMCQNVSNRTILCAYFLSISWFKYQNWLSQRRVLGNANSWKISASTPHHLRAEQLSRATYPAHLDTSTAAGTVAKKKQNCDCNLL